MIKSKRTLSVFRAFEVRGFIEFTLIFVWNSPCLFAHGQ